MWVRPDHSRGRKGLRAATITAAALVGSVLVSVTPGSAGTASGSVSTGSPVGQVSLTPETFANPPKEVRPGTRWWWDSLLTDPGFSLDDALKEVDAFAAAGFGRFEIAWATKTYGTAGQRDKLRAVAERAAADGLQLDMTLGASWPWHAPTAQGDLGHQELMYGRTDVSGPSTFSGEVSAAIGDSAPSGTLRAVTAARVITPGPAVTKADSPPASSTVLDPESLVDLTSRVDGTSLSWEVPAGDWIIFSFWQRAPQTCGAYTSEAGGCVSLIDADSVRAGLGYVDQNQVGDAAAAMGKAGHSFFEDSLEYTADELYWSSDYPAEFAVRRGYDMTKYLPLMFVQGVSDVPTPAEEPVPDFELPDEEGARYRHDYYQTLTDLYVDNHLEVIGQWAEKYGMQFRAQPAYGNNLDVTRSARDAARAGVLVDDESLGAGDTGVPDVSLVDVDGAYYDKPDSPQWHTAMEHYRALTSGSHQGGGLEISSELGATFTHELHTYLRDYKRMMDKEWAAGITRPLLHGVAHSPEGTPWPGASHFGGLVGESINYRTWPEWSHFKPLSDYWARGALVLQQGAARTDVAVLRDTFSGSPYFDGLELEKQGFTIGYVDPVGAVEANTGPHGELFPDGPSYGVLVVDSSQSYVSGDRMPGPTARAIDAASAKGLRVVFVGDLPTRGAGGKAPSSEDQVVQGAVSSILARSTSAHVATQADAAAAVQRLGVVPSAAWQSPARVYSQARETADATYYLLWNATGDTQRFTGSFAASGAPTELDLWTGDFHPVARYRESATRVELPLKLAPHETEVLMFRKGEHRPHVLSTSADDVVATGTDIAEVRDAEGGPQTVEVDDGRTRTVQLPTVTDAPMTVGTLDSGGLWQLKVTTYGPEGTIKRPAVPLAKLADWRTIPGLESESGVGTYTARVTLPASWTSDSRGTRLDLAAFEGSVQVSVNGTRVSPDIDPQAPLDITTELKPGDNLIKVELSTTPFNKAVVSSTTLVGRPAWPASATHSTQVYGLLGDVKLRPYVRGSVALVRRPDLAVANLTASQAKPKQTELSVSVLNRGDDDAAGVVVEFRDGQTPLGRTAAVEVPPGGSVPVSFTWDSRGVNGDHLISAVVDPGDTVAESDETNNAISRTITIRGNKVTNGSFETSSDGTSPAGWSSTGSTSYDTSGSKASDGTDAVGATGTGSRAGMGIWTSAPIEVSPGQSYDLAMTVATVNASSPPSLTVSYLDAAGTVLGKVTGITTSLTGDTTARQVNGQITIPAGASRVRLTLTGSVPTDLTPTGTVWLDDIWMW